MFLFEYLRVNEQSQFTSTGIVGEFRLYVHPDGPKQNCRLAGSTGAKPEAVTGWPNRASASAADNPVPTMTVCGERSRRQQNSRLHDLLGGSQHVTDDTADLSHRKERNDRRR
jgi:hypothetical protein